MFVTSANIRATLDETAEEEGELVCYLVDSPRNACYCIFVTFARSWVPFCVHCNVVFSIASLREAGGHLRVTGEVFVSIKETKTETSFALKRNSKIQFFPILFFCFDPEFFHLYAK